MVSLQKASISKRIIAAIFDGIIISIIAVGLIALLSVAFDTDKHLNTYQQAYTQYSTEYEVNLTIEEYNALTEAERKEYNDRALQAEEAFAADTDAVYAYNMFINLSLLIITMGVLIGVVLVEFVVPLLFGNGQTLGKKVFGIALMHKEAIRVSNLQLFIRAVLGKFAIELMIPIYILMMVYFNSIGVISVVILLVILAAHIICLVTTRTNSLLHDVMAGTVAVDMASQRIFDSREALIEYTKKLHASEAQKPTF
ncbi:MAG: RDD family protein [Ruminococcaceae bacterium]|nr:RDD family protein [Oscillospiraceae bacterium]